MSAGGQRDPHEVGLEVARAAGTSWIAAALLRAGSLAGAPEAMRAGMRDGLLVELGRESGRRGLNDDQHAAWLAGGLQALGWL